MMSAGNRLQLQALIDTCEQERDITNVQTRNMLTVLASCMLNGAKHGVSNSLISQDYKYIELLKNLEERVQ